MAVDEKYSSIILKRISESRNPSEQIELISDDDQRIPIHRVILTAGSKYFADELGSNWNFQEGDRNEGRRLEGTDGEILRVIVDYCYTGYIELTEEKVQTFLTIASRYQLDLLEEQCFSFYVGILCVTNSVEALMFAEEFSYAGLRQAALDLICENFDSVPTAEIQKLDHRLFQEILKSDKITSSEEFVFDRLVKWSEHGEREPFVPNLLKLIRLQDIKIEILRDTAEAFYKKFDCTELMLAEYRRRASEKRVDSCSRRLFFCLFAQYEKVNDPEHSAVKVARFKRESSSWEGIAEFALEKRLYFTMVLNENKMYVLGGLSNHFPCNTVSSFDLSSRQEEILPQMNISRATCTSIVFGEYIYVFGGWDESGALSSCERFDIKRKTWTEIKSMTVARSEVSAVVMNGCIYIAGGTDGRYRVRSTFESYDPERNVWTELAPMKESRFGFALIQSNGFIYAIGSKKTIEKYDPSENQWTQMSHLDDSHSICGGINIDGEIYVMKKSGELRRIEIDERGHCSFFPWVVETAYTPQNRHFLTLN